MDLGRRELNTRGSSCRAHCQAAHWRKSTCSVFLVNSGRVCRESLTSPSARDRLAELAAKRDAKHGSDRERRAPRRERSNLAVSSEPSLDPHRIAFVFKKAHLWPKGCALASPLAWSRDSLRLWGATRGRVFQEAELR